MKVLIIVLTIILICVILYGWLYADEHYQNVSPQIDQVPTVSPSMMTTSNYMPLSTQQPSNDLTASLISQGEEILQQIKNECQIDVDNLNSMFGKLNQLIQQNNGDLNVLTTDEAYNLINNITNTITKYDTNQIRCALQKINYNQCSSNLRPDYSKINLDQLNLALTLIDKYKPNLRNIYTWLTNNYMQLEADCGGDVTKLQKIRDLVGNVSSVFNNQ